MNRQKWPPTRMALKIDKRPTPQLCKKRGNHQIKFPGRRRMETTSTIQAISWLSSVFFRLARFTMKHTLQQQTELSIPLGLTSSTKSKYWPSHTPPSFCKHLLKALVVTSCQKEQRKYFFSSSGLISKMQSHMWPSWPMHRRNPPGKSGLNDRSIQHYFFLQIFLVSKEQEYNWFCFHGFDMLYSSYIEKQYRHILGLQCL